jgi:hypothetical protein
MKTDVMGVARLRLGDFIKEKQEEMGDDSAARSGKMTFGDALVIFYQRLDGQHLTSDHTFFAVDSRHQRQKGPEIHGRVARVFAEQVLEREPGRILPISIAYLVFCEFLKTNSMPIMKRSDFKGMFARIIREIFDLRLRNDIADPSTQHQTAGWKRIHTLDLLEAAQN